MKISSQVYVKGSIEAAEMYCQAFRLEKGLEIKNEAGCSNLIDRFGVFWWIAI